MIYHATNLISETFDANNVKYRLVETDTFSMVESGFEIGGGPEAVIRFISNDDNNDVAVRIYGLVHRTPPAKRAAVLEACNELCARVRFFKFYLDPEGNVNAEADLLLGTNDGCLGDCCLELFIRSMVILENEYHVLADALYGGNAGEGPQQALLRALDELRRNPIVLNTGEDD